MLPSSSHSKANRNWEERLRGKQKKAYFKSKTENYFVSVNIFPRIVYGLETAGWRSITASSIILKSYTNLYSSKLFFTWRIGVLQRNEQGFNKSYLKNMLIRSHSPVFASVFHGHCHWGGKWEGFLSWILTRVAFFGFFWDFLCPNFWVF